MTCGTNPVDLYSRFHEVLHTSVCSSPEISFSKFSSIRDSLGSVIVLSSKFWRDISVAITRFLFTGNWKFWFGWCFRIRCRWDSRWKWFRCLQFGMTFSDFKLVSNSVDIALIGFCFRSTRLIQKVMIRSGNLFVLLPRTIEHERMLARKKMTQLYVFVYLNF